MKWRHSRVRFKPKKNTALPGTYKPVESELSTFLPRYGSLWVPSAERRYNYRIWKNIRWPASRCRNCSVTRGLKALLLCWCRRSLARSLSLAVTLRLFSAAPSWRHSPWSTPLTMPTAPARRPSASQASPTTPSSTVRQHRSAESHHAFAAMSGQAPSLYSSSASSTAVHQQKIIHILVNRLRNKVLSPLSLLPPCSLMSCSYPLIQAWI